MARERSNCDVTLKVGDKNFPCHRKILAKHSPYFQAMFSTNFIEKDKTVIEIKGVDPDAMAVLLQSVYQKEVDIFKTNDILPVLQASSMLQFEFIQQTCVELIVHQWLTISTCLQTMVTADELDLITLHHKAQALALWEFSEVKETDAFLELPICYLEKYLQNDGLNTTESEFEVFEAGLCWLQDNPLDRKEYVLKILNCIRFTDIPCSDIRTMLLYPIISESIKSVQVLQCVLCIKEGKSPEEKLEPISDYNAHADTSNSSVEREIFDEDENSVSKQKKLKECECNTVQVQEEKSSILNNCCRCCISAEEPTTPIEDYNISVRNEYSLNGSNNYAGDNIEFCAETIEMAKQLLATSSRALPLVACVVGHKILKKNSKQKNSNDDSKRSKLLVNGGKPYLISFQKGRDPVPFLHLSKVNEGPLEPTGYKIICRGQEVYMIGGEHLLGYGNWNNSIWKYDVIREVWNFETSIASPRRHLSVCCLGDYIYIIGGFGRHRVIMNSVEKYHVRSRCWSQCASLPQSLYSAACCTYKGQIFVFGPQVYCYHPGSDNWFISSETVLPSNIAFSCAMPHGEWIYVTGTYSRELFRFAPDINATDTESQTSLFQLLGHFCYNTSNTCLVHNDIYSFSTDDDGNMYVESYSIIDCKFSVLWNSQTGNNNGISDFSPKHSIGCFPLIKY